MIKFFRRIRFELMENNQTKKYLKYALGEIILVVVGILIALQISEWNTNFKRHKSETQLLQDIHNEFLENKKQFEIVRGNHMVAYQATKKILSLLPFDLQKIEIDSVVYLLDQSYNHWTFNPQQSTINTLINTSSFDIISNRELRKLLQNWTDLYLDYSEEEIDAKSYVDNYYWNYMSTHYETKYVKNKRPYKDLNWDFLQSIEFNNAIGVRHNDLRNILDADFSEIVLLTESIDKIIELTAQ